MPARPARLALLPLLALAGPASAADFWPGALDWQPLSTGGLAVEDMSGDVADGTLDLVGDGSPPAAAWYVRDDLIFLRQHLAAEALAEDGAISTGLRAWLVETDGDPTTFDALVSMQGTTLAVDQNLDAEVGATATAEVALAEVDAMEWGLWRTTPVEETAYDGDVYLDLALPSPWLATTVTTPFRLIAATGTGAMGRTPDTDWSGGDDSLGPPALDTRWTDVLTLDGDEDGILTPVETAHGTDPANPDTDGGGRSDGAEDADQDGVVDAWETNPLDGTDDLDTDADGIPDLLEARCGAKGDDADADGVPDGDEGLVDTDGDALPDFCDGDDDGDGVRTGSEGTADTDGDGTPDYLDTDADDDGIADGLDGVVDLDCDTLRAFQDPDETDGDCADPDADGLDNRAEAACGSDPHGQDSDGDGLDDAQESCATDQDCDQLPDRIDALYDDGRCGSPDPPVDTACVDADPTDAWEDCPGSLGGGGGCAAVPSPGLLAAVLAAALGIKRTRRTPE